MSSNSTRAEKPALEVGRLKRKGDWVGLLVRLRTDVRRGDGMEARAGAVMIVSGNKGGLHLRGATCPTCLVSFVVVGVSAGEVDIIKRVAEPDWYTNCRGHKTSARLPIGFDVTGAILGETMTIRNDEA